jgi:xanthine dehydrogenase accessory factor
VGVGFNVVFVRAGHVGRALAQVLGSLPLTVSWVDSRAREFPSVVPGNIRVALTDAPLLEVSAARAGSWFLVMTHSHALDLDLVEAILRREDIAFCGMIGSATKRRSFESGLAKRGIAAGALERLTCPVGMPELEGKDPGTIAVSIAAQMLLNRERSAANLRGPPGRRCPRLAAYRNKETPEMEFREFVAKIRQAWDLVSQNG